MHPLCTERARSATEISTEAQHKLWPSHSLIACSYHLLLSSEFGCSCTRRKSPLTPLWGHQAWETPFPPPFPSHTRADISARLPRGAPSTLGCGQTPYVATKLWNHLGAVPLVDQELVAQSLLGKFSEVWLVAGEPPGQELRGQRVSADAA